VLSYRDTVKGAFMDTSSNSTYGQVKEYTQQGYVQCRWRFFQTFVQR